MKWVGLTGGIATGKSTVSKMLRDMGYAVVDADLLAREVSLPGTLALKEIEQAFGLEVVGSGGVLDRTRLAKIVFADEEKLKKLEAILHPKIQELRAIERRKLERQGCEVAFYDVPLLFEKKMQAEFDKVLLVYSSPAEQRKRMQSRDNFDDFQIAQRLSAQLPIDDKIKMSDYVVLNQGSIADLKANLQAVVQDILS